MNVPNCRIPVPLLSLLVGGAFIVAGCEDPDPGNPSSGAEGVALEEGIPVFEADPWWPAPLPENWIMAPVPGLAIDGQDRIWVTTAPDNLTDREVGAVQDPPTALCCSPSPPILEFDTDGNLVSSWDRVEAAGDEWPAFPHGAFVDHNDYVWIGSFDQHQVLKFTREGEHVFTIGELDSVGGSDDPDRLGMPGDIWVHPETNEVFIADGYVNRRVVVYDGETGEYLRHWGAYGGEPDDDYEHPERGADAEPSEQFGTAHGIVGSDDGLLYVADRRNNRIQVFTMDGEFVEERLVAPETQQSGTAFDVALSADPDQAFLYLADGTNHRIWILRRDGLEILDHFGRGGRQAGQLIRPHHIVTDSDGNIYVTEAGTQRVQRFLLQGVVAEE